MKPLVRPLRGTAPFEAVRGMGFSEEFIRAWNYYFSYCEGGFRERQIGLAQIYLAKPFHLEDLARAVRSVLDASAHAARLESA